MAPGLFKMWGAQLMVFFFLSSSISCMSKATSRQQLLEEYTQTGLQLPFFEHPQKLTTMEALVDALDVLQKDYFEVWQGIWPTSIDWTSAVLGTYLSAALITFSTSLSSFSSVQAGQNVIDRFFSQVTASYFGQDTFALRQEAYDDMLWVVLGWLESVKFIDEHSALYYGPGDSAETWYGSIWTPAFAHRARIFWDLASHGWDTSLCNGGMIWSPYLTPYKNAITNELYIAASISMYLYFPGDNNTAPFAVSATSPNQPGKTRDPKYLAAAIEGYKWLSTSNMTDNQGLYVDGFHISGLSNGQSSNSSNGTRCDARNEMVYTYNQGVLLSGQRGLYEATGARSYIEDGHTLIADVIAATGWNLKNSSITDSTNHPRRGLGKWQGLGRSGILEEACDAPGSCSQDGQTFKGIFFHHLTLFCGELPSKLKLAGQITPDTDLEAEQKNVRDLHKRNCTRYGSWIKHNAVAAQSTVNSRGKFGMWWGAPSDTTSDPAADVETPPSAIDYRNSGVPSQWKKQKYRREEREVRGGVWTARDEISAQDLNDRGRGRTVETQGGGVSVLRALWELVEKKT